MLTQISPAEENACDFKEGSLSINANCAVGNLSASLLSCEPFCITDNDSSKNLVDQDISGTDVLVDAFNSISIAESSEQRDNEGKDNVGLDDASGTKCCDVICSSPPRRSSRTNKLNQKAETRNTARRCRKTANKKPMLDLIFLKVVRRRRSCFSRARSSAWGLLGYIAQIFEQNTAQDVNQNEHEASQKAMSVRGGRKQNRNRTGQSSQRSKRKSNASTSCIRLKVKLGKEVVQSFRVGSVPLIDNDREKDWVSKTECPNSTKDIEDKSEEEVPRGIGFQDCNGNLEKAIMLADPSVLDVHPADKDIVEMLAGNTADNHNGVSSQEEVEKGLGVTVDDQCLDAGTSPDSEVINLIPDAQISGKVPEDMHDVLISSQACVAPGDVTSLSLPQMGSKKEKKKDKLHQPGNCRTEGRLPSPEIINNIRIFEKHGETEKMRDDSYSGEASLSTATGNAPGSTSSSDGISGESLPSSRVTDFGFSSEALKLDDGKEVDLCSSLGVGLESLGSSISDKPIPHIKTERQKLPKSSRSRGVSKSRPEVPPSVSKRGIAGRQKRNQTKPIRKQKLKKNLNGRQVVCKVENHQEAGDPLDDTGEAKTGTKSSTGDVSKLDTMLSGTGEQYLSPRNAWVRCDDCYKWRRIAATLADSIQETNCRWICKDNMDKDFADCSIPQEKSNAEINAELEISDASCEEDACDARLNCSRSGQKQSTVSQQSPWLLIKSNLFLHRSRKTQTIDEIMVCHCKPSLDGQMGCGDGCLNRMLNIECVQGTCPCGELCSNHQFQKRKYAKLKSFKCGRKGYGLQLLEDISTGQFLIEYVGEVLDMHAYEARQREYASKGHKHFYFMTLNGSEVIDACAKGNLGRFINHSCDPNCRTEKWMVNGEVCIGLFALRDIKKGEEVTFDYNYVRVFGAAAKKCVCGSSQCRGYIGGDPLNAEVIVQDDSDEEYPEPVMICENGEINDNLVSKISADNILENKVVLDKPGSADQETTVKRKTPAVLLKDKDISDNSATAAQHLDITTANEDSSNMSSSAASKLETSLEMEGSARQLAYAVQPKETSPLPDDETIKIMSAAQQESSVVEETVKKSLCSVGRFETSSLTSNLLPDMIDTKRKSKSDTEEDRRVFSKFNLVRTSRSSSVKKGKSKPNAVNVNKPSEIDNKSHILRHKPRKMLEGSSNGRFEAVQEKLNELLDSDGGISKRKDSSRGYLKLLLLTAATGDSGHGEAIQSNRDLSMILDALLKTRSRMVLVDILNKNGLQMLHNIMKRYRREFNKIPILRKLLKVLEYLAVREILTLEHINGGPPCPGVESFRESILTLTEHADKQVHQIARNFRDRWIPRPIRKNNIKQSMVITTPVDAGAQEACSASCNNGCLTSGTKTRKRKSRWDQPAETNPDPRSPQHKEQRVQPSFLQKPYSGPQPQVGEVKFDCVSGISGEGKSFPGCVHNFYQRIETNVTHDRRQKFNEDVPPGFSPLNSSLVASNASSNATDLHVSHLRCPSGVVMGHPQARFISRFSVSYGIPLSVVQQFGMPQSENVESWVVAPGMPFHPFPPLPPYPRDKRDSPACAANPVATNQPAEKDERNHHNPATHHSDQNNPSTSGASPPDMEILGASNQNNSQQARGSYNLGRKYFRQQKWNNSKLGPPWIRNRNGWGFMGNNSRNGMSSVAVGSGENEVKGPYGSEEVSTSVESSGNNFYQHPQHQN